MNRARIWIDAQNLWSRQLRCNCHSVRNGNNLVLLEILELIIIVTVCIVLATPIKLHPVGAVQDADARTTSGSVLQWASKRSDTDATLLLGAITVLLPQRNISFLCDMAGKPLQLGHFHPLTCKFE